MEAEAPSGASEDLTLKEKAERLKELRNERRSVLAQLSGATEADKIMWRAYVGDLNNQIEELSRPGRISLVQLMEELEARRPPGEPPKPTEIFIPTPESNPTPYISRSHLLGVLLQGILVQRKNQRLVSFVSSSAGTGKTKLLADLWEAVLALRVVAPAPTLVAQFEVPWERYAKVQLRSKVASVEVYGITFNSGTPFLLVEALMCRKGGQFVNLPIYSRIIWGEYKDGSVSWPDFVAEMHKRLEPNPKEPLPKSMLNVDSIAAEARAILNDRRGSRDASGLLLVDELSQVGAFDKEAGVFGKRQVPLSSALRSALCDLRVVGDQLAPMLILFSSLSFLFMDEEGEAPNVLLTASGRIVVCAGVLDEPTKDETRDFFYSLQYNRFFKVTSPSLADAELPMEDVVEALTFLSSRHMRAMQCILSSLQDTSLQYVPIWERLRGAFLTMSLSSSMSKIQDTILRSPLLCAVAFLGHPVLGPAADVVLPSRMVLGPDGKLVEEPAKPLTWDALVASSVMIGSANEGGRYEKPTILPSIFLSVIVAYVATRTKSQDSARAPHSDFLVDMTGENPVLDALTQIGRVFAAGSAAKDWELFHRAWELCHSISRSYINNTSKCSFTLAERYPASHGVCGTGAALHTALDDGRVLLGVRRFSTMADLLARPPADLIQFVWVPMSATFPAADAFVFHTRAGVANKDVLTCEDLFVAAFQLKTLEPTSNDDRTVDLSRKFVKPIAHLPTLFGDSWTSWGPRVAFIAIFNVRLSVDKSSPAEVQESVLSRKVRITSLPESSRQRAAVEIQGKTSSMAQKQLSDFMQAEGSNSILVARESLDMMYGPLFTGVLQSAILLVGAQVTTA